MKSQRPHAVLVSGAPGVGKSEAGRRITYRVQGEVALVDLDALGAIDPWRVDARRLDLMARNASHVIREYLAEGVRDYVVVGVMLSGMLHDRVVAVLDDLDFVHCSYGLRASPDVLAARICGDTRFRDRSARLADRELDTFVGKVPAAIQVHTDDLTVDQVVQRILDTEVASHPELLVI